MNKLLIFRLHTGIRPFDNSQRQKKQQSRDPTAEISCFFLSTAIPISVGQEGRSVLFPLEENGCPIYG